MVGRIFLSDAINRHTKNWIDPGKEKYATRVSYSPTSASDFSVNPIISKIFKWRSIRLKQGSEENPRGNPAAPCSGLSSLEGSWLVCRTHLKRRYCNAASSSAARNAASVHLQARSCRENEIRPLAACNHSKDPLGFNRQQFSKSRLAAAKWLKSRLPHWMMRCWGAGEAAGAAGDPKTAWNGDYLASVGLPQQLSLSSPDWLKNKGMGFDTGDRLDLCVWARGHVGVFHACGLIHWRSRDGDIFYEEHSCRGAIVCTARWQAGNPGDGWRPTDEKNK